MPKSTPPAPPMDALGGPMGAANGPMDQAPNMMGNDMGDEPKESEFDSGFDAGVDADPDEDPKKYIQQLTGKLSQELRKYNNDTEDEELNKYVAGMIIPQATLGLTDKGKKEIIGKIKKGNVSEPIDDKQPEEPTNDMPMEGRKSYKTVVAEIFQDILNNDEEDKRQEKKITNKKLPPTNPFIANR